MAAKICLIDGSGYIFRAFFALPPLTAPDGTPVNAVFGFTNMFLKLTSAIPCEYCLVLFDAKRQNFRNEIYPEYKGTRKEIPEDLIPQFPIIHEAVEALNLNYMEMEGYEADDLIATYANQALEAGLEVVVVSGDKDLMQLIRPGVEFYDPMKDKFFTPEDVKEKFGVLPDKVVDVQALAGDGIDNVPGVPGIGFKTAAQLINEFGSLEGVLQHASEIKQNKRREMIIEHAENARISLQLVTLDGNVPVEKPVLGFKCHLPQMQSIETFIDKYGFRSIKSRLERWYVERCSNHTCDEEIVAAVQPIETHYELIQTEAKLKTWLNRIRQNRQLALYPVTDGPSVMRGRLLGLALACEPGVAAYLPLSHRAAESGVDLFSADKAPQQITIAAAAKYLQPLFNDPAVIKIGAGIKSALHWLTQSFGETAFLSPIDDVSVISYDLDSSEHGHSLEELTNQFFNLRLTPEEELTGSGKKKRPLSETDLSLLLPYAAGRADFTLRLYPLLRPRLVAEQKSRVYENFDRPLITTLFRMEQTGIRVNAKALNDLSAYFDSRLKSIENEIFALAGESFNIGSPKQIGEILFDKQGHKGKKTPTGAWQTGADILEQLAENGVDLAHKILIWREFNKLKNTYTDALFPLIDDEDRIHTTYLQTVANTGRLSSTDPNLQNIPIRSEEGKKIRACFIARPGHKLISSDYSQVELRLLASVADVANLKKAFAAGIDIHTATASHVFGVPPEQVDANLRRHAKAINFGIVYGISQYGLAKNIGVTADEAKAYIDAYFAQMPEIRKYMEETIAFAHRYGYVLTPFGRKCSVGGINDKNKRISGNAERVAINAPIQGGAADLIKLAMNRLDRELSRRGMQTRMLLQVHDELVFEAPDQEVEEASALIKEVMETVVDFAVPFIAEVGVGDNWSQAH